MSKTISHDVEKKLLFILGPLMLLSPLSIDMYVPFMPELVPYFKTSPALIQMTITMPLLILGIGQIFWGVVCDRVGRVPALRLNLFLYILSCVACFFLAQIEYFIAARVFQSFAVCGCQVMTLSLVRDLTEGRQTQTLFSRLLGISGTAPIFAPYLGSFLADITDSWKVIFPFLAFYTICCISLLVFLPQPHKTDAQSQPDRPFSFIELLSDTKHIISQRNFIRWAAVPVLVMVGLFLFVAMSTHYLQVFAGYSKQSYSVALALNSIVFMLASFYAPAVNTVLGEQRSIHVGLFGIMVAQICHGLYWALLGQNSVVFLLSIFMSSMCYGIINGAGVRLTLEGFGKNTGLATSLLGFFQFSVASFVGSMAIQPPVHSPLSLILSLCLGAAIVFIHTSLLSEKNKA